MKRVGYMLVAVVALTGGVAYMDFSPARADGTSKMLHAACAIHFSRRS